MEHKHKYSEYHAGLLRWHGGKLVTVAKESDHRLAKALENPEHHRRRIFGK